MEANRIRRGVSVKIDLYAVIGALLLGGVMQQLTSCGVVPVKDKQRAWYDCVTTNSGNRQWVDKCS